MDSFPLTRLKGMELRISPAIARDMVSNRKVFQNLFVHSLDSINHFATF